MNDDSNGYGNVIWFGNGNYDDGNEIGSDER